MAAPVRMSPRMGPAHGAQRRPVATPSRREFTSPKLPLPVVGCASRLPSATKGRASQSAKRADNNVAANAVNSTSATMRPYWLTRTAQDPPTAASVAIAANVMAMPASMGRPLVRNFCSDRANTKGITGRMQGLKMVSTPPKYTNNAMVMGLRSYSCQIRPATGQLHCNESSSAAERLQYALVGLRRVGVGGEGRLLSIRL